MTTQFVQDGAKLARQMVGHQAPTGFRWDAGEGVFFERQLEAVEGRFYEKKLRELKYRRLIPVTSADGPGAATITYYFYTKFGAAKIIANPTDDLPRVDVAATRHTAEVRVIGDAFGFSTQEIRQAQFANVPLEAQRAAAARRAINELMSDIAWNGDATYGLGGVLSNANVPDVQVQVAAGGGGSRVWGVDKTPLEIVEDIGDRITQVDTDTFEVHQVDTLLLPIDKLRFIRRTPMEAAHPTMTIGKWISEPDNGFGLSQIESLPELSGSGTGASDQGLLYENDDEILQLRVPMEMITHPPERRNLQFHVPAEAEIAGVVIRYPLALIKFYGI